MLKPHHKIAIYMDGHLQSDHGKMGFGVMRYSTNPILCVVDTKHPGKTVAQVNGMPFNVPIVATVEEAAKKGAEVLIIGLAPSGGKFLPHWMEAIKKAIHLKMSIVNGLHDLLKPVAGHLLNGEKQWIWDIRLPQFTPPVGTALAAKLSNKRVLTIGTDMAVGKMTTGIELYRWLESQNVSTAFLATGQIGITIMGKGIPLDAFKVDYAAGAVEQLVLSEKDKEIVIVEGQGSLVNPASTSPLPLMRGSCPTHLVLCHRADLLSLRKLKDIAIPPLKDFIQLNEDLASVNGSLFKARCVGISVNTSPLESEEAARRYIGELEAETGMAVTDVVRFGAEKIGLGVLGNGR